MYHVNIENWPLKIYSVFMIVYQIINYMQIQQKITVNRVYKQIGKNVLLYVLTAWGWYLFFFKLHIF